MNVPEKLPEIVNKFNRNIALKNLLIEHNKIIDYLKAEEDKRKIIAEDLCTALDRIDRLGDTKNGRR